MTKLHLLTQSLTESELKEIVDKEAVSTRMKRVGYDVISDIINLGTHLNEFKTIKCGTLDDFKKNMKEKLRIGYTPTLRELLVSDIRSVQEYTSDEDIEDSGILLNIGGKIYKLPYYQISNFKITYSATGELVSTKLDFDKKSRHYSRRFRYGGCQTSITYEALVKIGYDVLYNEIPFDLRGLHCNIINCTGNDEKAKELGLVQSFHPRLMEWIIEEEHGGHEAMCVKAFKLTGKAWEISARDTYLRELMKGASNKEIAQYLEWFCMPA